jgi:hypothetical protein
MKNLFQGGILLFIAVETTQSPSLFQPNESVFLDWDTEKTSLFLD